MLNVSSSARYEEQVPGILLMLAAFSAFPIFDVAPARISLADSGQYRASDTAGAVQGSDGDPIRAGRDPYTFLNSAITDKSFTLKDRGKGFTVDPKDIRDCGGDEDMAIASAAMPAVATVLAYLHSATLTALYGVSNTQACAAVWSDDSSSDPVKDWHTARNTKFKGSPVLPNALHIPRVIVDHLSRHAKFKGLFTSNKDDVVPEFVRKNLARVFEVEYVTVDESRWNTANPQQAASYAYIANQTKVCFYRRESGLLTSAPQTIRTFVRTLSIAPSLESLTIPGAEIMADAMLAWTWAVPNPGGRAGIAAMLAQPNIVNAETACVLTGAA